MITNEVQYRATKAHLRRFEEAVRSLEGRVGAKASKMARVELEAVQA